MDEKMRVNACCMLAVENGVWFVQGMVPILYFFSYKEGRIVLAKCINIGKVYGTAYFSAIYQHDNKLFLIPNNTGYVVTYDIRNEKMSFAKINDAHECNNFREVYEFQGTLFCMPYRYGKILCIDMSNDEFDYIDMLDTFGTCCINGTCRIGNCVYCIEWNADRIYIFNLVTKTINEISPLRGAKLTSIASDGIYEYVYDIRNKCVRVYCNQFSQEVGMIPVGFSEAVLKCIGERAVIVDSVETYEMVCLTECKKQLLAVKEEKVFAEDVPWKMCCWNNDDIENVFCITPKGKLIRWVGEKINSYNLSICENKYVMLNNELIYKSKIRIFEERRVYSINNLLEDLTAKEIANW